MEHTTQHHIVLSNIEKYTRDMKSELNYSRLSKIDSDINFQDHTVVLKEHLSAQELVNLMMRTGAKFYSVDNHSFANKLLEITKISWIADNGVLHKIYFSSLHPEFENTLIETLTRDNELKALTTIEEENCDLVKTKMEHPLQPLQDFFSEEDIHHTQTRIADKVLHRIRVQREASYKEARCNLPETAKSFQAFHEVRITSRNQIWKDLPAWFTEYSGGYTMNGYMRLDLTDTLADYLKL